MSFNIPHDWEDPEELHQLFQAIREQRDDSNVPRLRAAYHFAEAAHEGQARADGEPYITHPLAVAGIAVRLHMDDDSIIAAFLHDVIEDCKEKKSEELWKQDIRKQFGEDVLRLVEALTKIDRIEDIQELSEWEKLAVKSEQSAESLRKLLLATAQDLRVVLVKLADRLHNMQTLNALRPDKQTRIANETLDVYAPLAARLGMYELKGDLEDLSFKVLHPHEYADIAKKVGQSLAERERIIREATITLKQRFEEEGIRVIEIKGRPKRFYSIFTKINKQNLQFGDLYDLLALRIIVDKRLDCYGALGVVHDIFKPMPTLFYDYIGQPKPNGYQSLHTKVVGPHGQALEVQIRTREMHEIAEYGVAAHWTYKEGKDANEETKRLATLREKVFSYASDPATGSEYFQALSTDLFTEQVFVMTPKGEVKELPKDSTPIDFAFHVHSQIAMTLSAAKVNGIMMPLSTRLHSGDVVELITKSTASPSRDWLEHVKSSHTQAKLRAYFRKQTRDADAQRGREALDRELKSLGLDPRAFIGEEKLKAAAKQFDSCDGATELLSRVGSGLISVQNAVAKLRGTVQDTPVADRIEVTKTKEGKTALVTEGDVMVARARCCSPIPGDEIVGYVSRGRGMILHRKVCPNAQAYHQSEPDRVIQYGLWEKSAEVYTVPVRVEAIDRKGLLADISAIFGGSKTNVSAVKVTTYKNQTALIDATIDVADTEHLNQVLNKVGDSRGVISVLRMFGRSAK